MAHALREHDWAKGPLGPIHSWPPELLSAVNLLLSSKLMSCLIWGPQRILLYNDAYRPLLGTKHPAFGEPFLEVWQEIRQQADAIISGPFQTGDANLFEQVPFQILLDGVFAERICTLTNTPIWSTTAEAPQVAGLYQTVIDHTDGILAERRWRESERRLEESYAELQAIYDGGAVAGALIDPRTFHYLRVNKKLAEMLGQPAENIVGTSVFDLAANVRGLRDQLEQVAAGHSLLGVTEEGTLVGDGGDHRVWHSNYVPIRSATGEIIGISAASMEITSQKKAEAALIQNEKLAAVGRLAASIAHEINNPLESVTNLLYLARRSDDLAIIDDYLETAERELRRVSAIAIQTLRFYKQSSKAELIHCEDLFKSVLVIHQGRLQNANIQVEKRKRATRPVRCFDGEIRQVLNNLVSNAIDAMSPAGGRLHVRSREATRWKTGERGLVLTVADNGTGMAPEVRRKIFEAFYTTKGIGGTGLGLWVSQEIVDRHAGTLHVRSSQTTGASGTVFSLFLPFEAVDQTPRPVRAPAFL